MRIVIDLQGAQTESRYRGIGRYSLSLAQAMARNAGEHEIWLALNSNFSESVMDIRQAFDGLIPRERIRVFEVPKPVAEHNPANAWRTRTAELIREHFLQQLKPDVIHVSSLFEGYVDDAVVTVSDFASDQNTAVTLYDLIPYLDPKTYLPTGIQRDYYYRKIRSLKRARLLLAISEYSRREAIEALDLPEEQVVTIKTAVDAQFCPIMLAPDCIEAIHNRYGIHRKMVMYAPGGFDTRKNFEGLISAYGLLPTEVRVQHQLVIASKIADSNREYLRYLCKKAGLAEDELVLTGYVSNEDLIALYNLATLFVFPSKHEGFGLPALEAMACGAPTIGSNRTSIPEVIGREDALFNPTSAQSIANCMAQALKDESWRTRLREHGLQQAKKFSWDISAKIAIRTFENRIDLASNTHSPWSQVLHDFEQHYQDLVAGIAKHSGLGTGPSDRDLQSIAAGIAVNLEQIDRLNRKTTLPESITWRIEGPFDSSYSLALLNRETARALEALGHQVVLHSTEGPGDFEPSKAFLSSEQDLAKLHQRSSQISQEEADVTSRNLYPPRVSDMRSRLNLLHHYAWEESGFPLEWVESFNEHLQGLTCLSTHVQKVMIDNGVSVPLETSGCGVDHWERIKPDKSYQLVGRSFRFLHVSSCFPRKGADVLLKAYGQAFSAADDITLIIKTFSNPHNEARTWLNEAKKEKLDYPDVQIIEEDLTDSQLKALYEGCHVLVAPSRAEGFGLPMAEAMLSGLPVITTGWGGQCDFCTPETAWLVDFIFKPAETHFGLFNSVWAEPDPSHLAQIMREVYQLQPRKRCEKPNRGRDLLLQQFKWKDIAQKLVTSARFFSCMECPEKPKIGWITTWNTKCGIAAYSEHLIKNIPSDVVVFAAHTGLQEKRDERNVIRCWTQNESDTLEELSLAIDQSEVQVLIIQFNYGFFNFEHLSKFLTRQAQVGRIVVVMLHATSDPPHVPHKRLKMLTASLSCCHRVLVHAPADLNRLKTVGLVSNVALFPHGVIDWSTKNHDANQHTHFTIASYGFFLPHKGLFELIDAVKMLVDSGRDVRLKMVNAEYPIPESAKLIQDAKGKITSLGLNSRIDLITNFLADHESLSILEDSDLIVFPYQDTGESSSAAVRYGLATAKPVAVTPLAIFDDVSRAVFKLPGCHPEKIAHGIGELIRLLGQNDEKVIQKQEEAGRWRTAHKYSRLGQSLYNIICALIYKHNNDVRKMQ